MNMPANLVKYLSINIAALCNFSLLRYAFENKKLIEKWLKYNCTKCTKIIRIGIKYQTKILRNILMERTTR